MTSEEVIERVKSQYGDNILKAEVTLGDAVIHVTPDSLHDTAKFLKEDPELNFDYLCHITGVDYLEQERDPRFESVYEFHSIDKNHSIRLRVGLPDENPTVQTVSDLWPSAVFSEREMFDMFGFHIEGHPNLKRLLMPEEWEGHPLRKDYDLTHEDVAFSHNINFRRELVKEKILTRHKPVQD
ncbi:MAG: NADH-quinone oxidoreductase subunit C [Nitrospinota bacterium]|nr:NADH-quinone oxidoreductase subunit C [Nitrospinota bacterium]